MDSISTTHQFNNYLLGKNNCQMQWILDDMEAIKVT